MRPNKDFEQRGCADRFSKLLGKVLNKQPPWITDCIKHDLQYWMGGSSSDRKIADSLLRRGIANSGHPILSIIIYTLIRFCGCPGIGFGLQWGHGHVNDRYFEKYYDRHHDVYVLLEQECIKLNITPKELYGDSNYD